jgi:hypothetical protein
VLYAGLDVHLVELRWRSWTRSATSSSIATCPTPRALCITGPTNRLRVREPARRKVRPRHLPLLASCGLHSATGTRPHGSPGQERGSLSGRAGLYSARPALHVAKRADIIFLDDVVVKYFKGDRREIWYGPRPLNCGRGTIAIHF